MATAYLTFAHVESRGAKDAGTIMAPPAQSETVTTSGTSASGTKRARAYDVCQVWCATTVAAVAGVTPTATVAAGIICPAGVPTFIHVAEGDVVALIDA